MYPVDDKNLRGKTLKLYKEKIKTQKKKKMVNYSILGSSKALKVTLPWSF